MNARTFNLKIRGLLDLRSKNVKKRHNATDIFVKLHLLPPHLKPKLPN